MVLSTDCSKGILRDSGFVQHGAQPERGYNTVLFILLSGPRPVSFTLGIHSIHRKLRNDMESKIIAEAARATLDGSPPFPEIVRRLLETGVEYYHVDYIAQPKTLERPVNDH